jgi:hypothetical protein
MPCHNEETAIGKVAADVRLALPGAATDVYDNNSTSRTVAAAARSGAIVRREQYQGKGRVVRRMLTDTGRHELKPLADLARYAPAKGRRRS